MASPPSHTACLATVAGLLALFLTFAPSARAQVAPLSGASSVSVLTAYPGDAVYNRWGHTAIRVADPAAGFDVSFNYGTFDFGDPYFVPKFIYGQLDYLLSIQRTSRALAGYRAEGRPVVEQTLALSLAQRQAVFDFLRVNAEPENRVYRYDFLFDNCATRPRDVLLAALGGALTIPPEPDPDATFRTLVSDAVADDALLLFGFDLALGVTVDRKATPYEAHFLPLVLMDALEGATLTDSTTGARPLVAQTDTLFTADGYAPPARAFSWPTLLCWLLLALGTLVTWRGSERARLRFDRTLLAVVGLAGLILAWMWFGSLHHVTRANFNLLWALPTHFFAAIWLRRLRASRWGAGYAVFGAICALGAIAVSALGPQAMSSAVVPLGLVIALRLLAPVMRGTRGRGTWRDA